MTLKETCPECYRTIDGKALLWSDREGYESLSERSILGWELRTGDRTGGGQGKCLYFEIRQQPRAAWSSGRRDRTMSKTLHVFDWCVLVEPPIGGSDLFPLFHFPIVPRRDRSNGVSGAADF